MREFRALASGKFNIPEPIITGAQQQAMHNRAEMRDLYAERGRDLVQVIKVQVEEMQKNLLSTESLLVYCDAGHEQIVVEGFEFPTWNIAVVTGTDIHGNKTRRITAVEDVKLSCKIVARELQPRKARIGFELPPA